MEERLANSLSVYYGEPVALAVLILSREASKQLALSMVTYPLTASNWRNFGIAQAIVCMCLRTHLTAELNQKIGV